MQYYLIIIIINDIIISDNLRSGPILAVLIKIISSLA